MLMTATTTTSGSASCHSTLSTPGYVCVGHQDRPGIAGIAYVGRIRWVIRAVVSSNIAGFPTASTRWASAR